MDFKFTPRRIINKLKAITFSKQIGTFTKVPYEKGHYPNGINYFGHLKSSIGLGQGSRLYGLSLSKSDIPSCFIDIPLVGVSQSSKFYDIPLSKKPIYSINLFHINPENLYALRNKFNFKIFNYRYNIGTFLWELDIVPQSWLKVLKFFDEFWVPSNHVKNCLSKVTDKPIKVIPYGMEKIEINKLSNKFNFNGKFTFLTMFDSKSNIERKNPLMTIDAFKDAFGYFNEVKLVVKANNLTEKDRSLLKEHIGNHKNIEILDLDLTRNDVYSLIRSSNCLVSLHRAEGFGLTLAEAMSLGVPVLATAYSSTVDFANEKNSYAVSYKLVPSNVTYQNEQGFSWAEPNFKEAVKQMLNVYNGYKKEEKLKEAKKTIDTYLSIKHSSSLMVLAYKEIINC